MIPESEVETAVHWLANNAADAARAKAERVFCEEYRKSLKAILKSESGLKTDGQREDFAYSHDRYLAHLDALKEAVFRDEEMRAKRVAAEVRIAAWQSQQANMRATRI